MQTPLLLKIRILLAMIIGGCVFGLAGWNIIAAHPFTPLTLTHLPPSGGILAEALLLGILASLITFIVAGRYGGQLAPAGMLVGVAWWALHGHNLGKILIKTPDVAERNALFRQMTGETVLWFIILVIPFALFGLISRSFLRPEKSQKTQENEKNLENNQNEDNDRPVHTISSEIHFYRSVFGNLAAGFQRFRRFITPSHITQTIKSINWTNGISALLLSSVIGGIFLKLFAQSCGVEYEPGGTVIKMALPLNVAQSAFALFFGFLLAAYFTHQLFPQMQLWFILPAPLLIAVLTYFNMGRGGTVAEIAAMAPVLVPAGGRVATILPIQFMSFGLLGVVAGYWWAIRGARNRAYLEMYGEPEKKTDSLF